MEKPDYITTECAICGATISLEKSRSPSKVKAIKLDVCHECRSSGAE